MRLNRWEASTKSQLLCQVTHFEILKYLDHLMHFIDQFIVKRWCEFLKKGNFMYLWPGCFRIADNRRFWSSAAFDAFRFGAFAFSIHRGGERRSGDVEVVRNKGFRTGWCKVLPREAGEHRLFGLNHHRPCCCFLRSSPTTHTSKQIFLLLLSEPVLETVEYPGSRVRYVIRPLPFVTG